MGILSAIGAADAPFLPYLNTGTHLDLATGSFVPGIDGATILNGGLAMTNGTMGKPQTFKSTLTVGCCVQALVRCPGSEMFFDDTEFSQQKKRLVRMHDLYLDDPERRLALQEQLGVDKDGNDIESDAVRLRITNPNGMSAEEYFDKIKELADYKIKNRKHLEVEIPLLDPKTGKPQRMLIPTFAGYDSWSKAASRASEETLEKHSASSSDTNTVFMKDGRVKSLIMRQIPALSARAGLYWFLTAHVGDKIEMNAFAPPSKDLQFMKQGEKAKGVGADFLFLASNLLEVRSPKLLTDGNKECEYPLPTGATSPTEMNQITAILTRCKNNGAGAQINPVLSQTNGLEPGLSNYDYLKENDYFGLVGSKVMHRPALHPDMVLSRTQAMGKLRDYKTARAIEILAQLCYIQNNWTLRDMPVPFNITPQALFEALDKSSYAISDILNSRGWWTYHWDGLAADDPIRPMLERPYLSLWDILALTTGQYTPKFFQAKTVTTDAVAAKKAA